MHCLPVRRNVELSDEILDSPNSLVTQEASNRVWAAQAVLSEILAHTNPTEGGVNSAQPRLTSYPSFLLEHE